MAPTIDQQWILKMKKKINSAYFWSIIAKEKKIPRSKPGYSLYHEDEGLT